MNNVYYRQVERDDKIVVEDIHTVVVHRFSVGDTEDPDVYAGYPIYLWQQSEAGKFVMNHAIEPPLWVKNVNHMTWGFDYVIQAKLLGKHLTEFLLRFGDTIEASRTN